MLIGFNAKSSDMEAVRTLNILAEALQVSRSDILRAALNAAIAQPHILAEHLKR